MKVFVLGSTGMLGRYVYTYLKSKGFNVIGTDRSSMDALGDVEFYLNNLSIKKDDVVINCIGKIPQHGLTNNVESILYFLI
jgi:nucleoside-diphosphate-sugar epimerase